jgi:hypothetical protein
MATERRRSIPGLPWHSWTRGVVLTCLDGYGGVDRGRCPPLEMQRAERAVMVLVRRGMWVGSVVLGKETAWMRAVRMPA